MVEYNLLSDETVIMKASGSIMAAFFDNIILSFLTAGIWAFFAARNSGVAVTDQRIIIKEGGLIGNSTSEIRLDNVQGVSEEGGFVTVSNAAGESITIRSGDPGEIRNAINRAQNK